MPLLVLEVDDEPIVREVVVRYLAREGHETLEAADGLAARDAIEQLDPDLVVLDVMLPGTDGLELCRWIRSRSELPVIMLTVRGEGDRWSTIAVGAMSTSSRGASRSASGETSADSPS